VGFARIVWDPNAASETYFIVGQELAVKGGQSLAAKLYKPRERRGFAKTVVDPMMQNCRAIDTIGSSVSRPSGN
jgi:hypothetical protein